MAGQNTLLVEDDDDDIEIALGTPEPEDEVKKPEREAKPEGDDDERLDADQRDDDEDDDEARAIDRRDDLTADQKRDMRREQRRQQRERRRRFQEELRAENADLRAQMQAIVQQTRALMAETTHGQLRTAEEHLRRADAALADAIERGDGRAHSQALEYRDKAREAVNALRGKLGQEQQALRSGVQPQAQQPQIDPRMARHFVEFQRKVNWYDPTGRDLDSKIVQAIDADVAQAGFDPTTPEYWEELEDRVRERLPGKFKTQTSRRGPPMSGREASSAGRASGGGSEALKIPAALKQNMIEAGIWGDPKKRDAAIKDYLRIRREEDRRR